MRWACERARCRSVDLGATLNNPDVARKPRGFAPPQHLTVVQEMASTFAAVVAEDGIAKLWWHGSRTPFREWLRQRQPGAVVHVRGPTKL